jgi:hypothetical protein
MDLVGMAAILDMEGSVDTAADLLKDSTLMGQELEEESAILLPPGLVTQEQDLILTCTVSSSPIPVTAAMAHGLRMNTVSLDKY